MGEFYDCFLFFDEFELLRARLVELSPFMHRFVLVESARDFSNRPKPFYFEENKHLFKEYLHQIIHVKIDRFPVFVPFFYPFNPKIMEDYQRNYVRKVLKNLRNKDIVILGDVSEIPSRYMTSGLYMSHMDTIIGFRMHRFFYAYNNKVVYHGETRLDRWQVKQGLWYGCGMVPFHILKKTKPSRIRKILMSQMHKKANNKCPQIPQAGWKFSYIGDADAIAKRLEHRGHKPIDKEAIALAVQDRKDLFSRDIEFGTAYIQDDFPVHFQDRKVQQRLASYFQ